MATFSGCFRTGERRPALIKQRVTGSARTGIRPGEKLYEELACDNEQTCPTSHKKIRVWQLPTASQSQIRRMFEMLANVIDADRDRIVSALMKCVPEYQPTVPPAEETIEEVEVADDQAARLRLLARAATRAA